MRYGLTLGLILSAVVDRLIPHPDNFTPIMAVALFAGATLPTRIAYVVPLAALVAGNLLLGHPLDWMALVVYGCLLASVGIGQWLAKRRTWTRTGLAAVAGSLIFYLVTNFAVGSNRMDSMRTRLMARCNAMSWRFLSFATRWPETFSGQRCCLVSTSSVTTG
jgi:zinc transporter ZupT